MEFLEHKIELVCFLYITEETEVIVNSIYGDILEAKYERTNEFIDVVYSWDWICLYICPVSFTMMNDI